MKNSDLNMAKDLPLELERDEVEGTDPITAEALRLLCTAFVDGWLERDKVLERQVVSLLKKAGYKRRTATNHYVCSECGSSWEDEWTCGCDDECPSCATVVSPERTDFVYTRSF